MEIAEDRVVMFHYTLKDDSGEEIESSRSGEPLAYIHGKGNIIPGLEEALEGHTVGDQFDVELPPGDAYGKRDERLVQEVPRDIFEGVDEVEVGMQFRAESQAGEQMVTVTEVEGEEVTVDGNHPLAGETLHFDVEVTGVREATDEELDHGHPHAGGEHSH